MTQERKGIHPIRAFKDRVTTVLRHVSGIPRRVATTSKENTLEIKRGGARPLPSALEWGVLSDSERYDYNHPFGIPDWEAAEYEKRGKLRET